MALLNFPSAPNNGDYYPVTPLPGQQQYRWESAEQTWRLLGPATGVTPGCYGDDVTVPRYCVDAQGRITSVTNVPINFPSGSVTSITAGTGLLGGTITTSGTISLDTSYTDTLYLQLSGGSMAGVITFDPAQTFPGTVTSITAGTGLNGGTITSTGTIDLANTTVTAGSYTSANITVDAQGRITAASNGPGGVGTVTSITAGTGLNGGTITSTGTIDLANTAVVPNSYTYGSFTVDAQGRLTAASSGTTPNTTVTSPITNTGTGILPVIGIQTATTGQLGAVQVGANVQVAAGVISVLDGTTAQKGVLQVGTNIQETASVISVLDALTTQKGVIEIATQAEQIAGTDTTRASTPGTSVAKTTADQTGFVVLPSSGTAPGTTGYFHYNTTSNHIEYYNGSASKTALEREGDNMSGALGIINGSAAAPAIAFNSSPSTGIFSPKANAIAFASAGTQWLTLEPPGYLLYGTTTKNITFPNNPYFEIDVVATANGLGLWCPNNVSSTAIVFQNLNGRQGFINIDPVGITVTSLSDYRTKENITPINDGIERLKRLKPSRFNFIYAPEQRVDGFLAHEVQDVVPNAVTGVKDEEDEEGRPVHQSMDNSKLVPLLTAALQEAIAKIEELEKKIDKLEV